MNCKERFSVLHMLSIYWWKVKLIELTGGRPMIFIGYNFTDKVSGLAVNDYQDRLGRIWMANSKWSLFRVRKNT